MEWTRRVLVDDYCHLPRGTDENYENLNMKTLDSNQVPAEYTSRADCYTKLLFNGLFYKLKRAFPHTAYTLLKSYLSDRTFQVRYQEEYTTLHAIQSGVPQGSILGPILCLLHTADLPETANTMTAT